MILNPLEQRVLGSLIEKEMTTPDYYPLTLNSLTLACNQKSNRQPVTSYSETEVMEGFDNLKRLGLAVIYQTVIPLHVPLNQIKKKRENF